MSIFINKNGEQIGPFTEQMVLEMIKSGELSPYDLGIRHGESEWQTLSNLFPHSTSTVLFEPQLDAEKTTKKGRGCLLLPGIGLIIIAVLVGIGGLANYKMRNFNDFACIYAKEEKTKADELYNQLSPEAHGADSESLFRLSSSEQAKLESWKTKLETVKTWNDACLSVKSAQSSWLRITYLICGAAVLIGLFGIAFVSISFLKKS